MDSVVVEQKRGGALVFFFSFLNSSIKSGFGRIRWGKTVDL